MIHLTQPDFFIPIHGELRQLRQHAKLAHEVGIPEENIAVLQNGQTVEFANGKMRKGEKVPASYVYVDGSGVGVVSKAVMKDREGLSQEGVMVVNLIMDQRTGKPIRMPEIISRGFITYDDAEDLFNGLRAKIFDTAAKANGSLQKDVEQAVGNYLYRETHRRPMIFVNVVKN
jgi:ribonuclease J